MSAFAFFRVTVETESVNMAVVGYDKKFTFQPLLGKKFISLSGKDLQESLMKWYLYTIVI